MDCCDLVFVFNRLIKSNNFYRLALYSFNPNQEFIINLEENVVVFSTKYYKYIK